MNDRFDLTDISQVVIVDDDQSEAMPIIKAFSRLGVSSVYYEEGRREIPTDVLAPGLVFLDLVLGTTNDTKSIISMVHAALKRIIGKRIFPYILVLWSNHTREHVDGVIGSIEEDAEFTRPVKIIPLEKSKYFEVKPGRNGDYKRVVPEDKLIELSDDISEALDKLSIASVFWQWNRIVSTAGFDLTGKLFPEKLGSEEEWLTELKTRINEIAIIDLHEFETMDDASLVKNVWQVLSRSIGDFVYAASLDTEPREAEFRAENGSKGIMLCSLKSEEGNLFEIVKRDEKKLRYCINGKDGRVEKEVRAELDEKRKKNIAAIKSVLYLRQALSDKIMPGAICELADIEKDIDFEVVNALFKQEIQEDDIQLCWLELTPLCDYACKKKQRILLFESLLSGCGLRDE